MPQFKPLKQNRIYEAVMGQLKEAILSGSYKPGEKLPSEQELTELFQVSRGVIREAIRALEITGFLITKQGPAGGAFVTELSLEHVGNAFLDLFLSKRLTFAEMGHVRRLVEPDVARLAAINITEEGKISLAQARDKELQPTLSITERQTINWTIHLTLAEMCGNNFLEAIMKSLLRLTYEMAMVIEPAHEGLHKPGEHEEVIDAVLAGNGAEAHAIMTRHVDKFYGRLIEMEKAYHKKHEKSMQAG